MKSNPNIEIRISTRAKSIFGSFGAIVNDFYLEAGIYFVGGFNASLVAWDIYTDLVANNQPMAYAVAIAIIAFIAVEGLAVYLVGAAAKTSNGLLWFFSVVFACFFTFAHYRQMTNQGDISEYITLAIPFFVVVGYWARTVKIDVEASNEQAIQTAKDEAAHQRQIEDEAAQATRDEAESNRQIENEDRQRQFQIEDEDRQRRRQIEDEERQLNRQLQLDNLAKNHELKLAKIEAKKVNFDGQNGGFLAENGQKLANANEAKKDKIAYRRRQILTIANDEKLTQTELAARLGVSLGTIKNDLKAMNGSMK